MRLRLAFLLFGFIIAGSFFRVVAREGQQPTAAAPQTKFTSSSALVLVPVLVGDNDRQPVQDLKASDFEIFDNGKRQTVASFDPPNPSPRSQPAASSGETEFSNLDAPTPRRLVIIALDAQNTSPGNKPFVRDAVTRFLNRALDGGDRIAVIALQGGGIKIIHGFSQDAEALRRATEKVRVGANLEPLKSPGPGTQSGGTGDEASIAIDEAVKVMEANAQQIQEDVNEGLTGDSMRAVAKAFGPIPGRKSMIWVTDAFRRRQDAPILSGRNSSAEAGRGTNTMIFDTVFRSLNDANIAVYPVDTRGLFVLIPDGGLRGGGARMQLEQKDANIDTMLWFAQETGGKAAWGRNDILTALERAFSDSDYTYLLTFGLPANAKKGWHTLSVKVNRPGTHVVTRTGFFVGSGASQTAEQELVGALRTPFVYNALPLMVRWAGVGPGSSGKKAVKFQLAIPPGALAAESSRLELDLRAAASDTRMKPAGDMSRKITADLSSDSAAKLTKGGFSFTGQIELPPGEYTVNFAIRDNMTGRIGSLLAPLRVE